MLLLNYFLLFVNIEKYEWLSFNYVQFVRTKRLVDIVVNDLTLA